MWGLPKGGLCEANDVLEKQSTTSAIERGLPKEVGYADSKAEGKSGSLIRKQGCY